MLFHALSSRDMTSLTGKFAPWTIEMIAENWNLTINLEPMEKLARPHSQLPEHIAKIGSYSCLSHVNPVVIWNTEEFIIYKCIIKHALQLYVSGWERLGKAHTSDHNIKY